MSSANPRRPRPRPSPHFDDSFAEKLAWILDSSIGVGPISVGLDGLIGLIPGIGDVFGAALGGMIILRALHNGVHHAAILRMLVNLGIDTLLGAIPVVGDVFDFAYKANSRNLRIYKESLSGTREPLRDWGFLALVVGALFAIVILPILGLIFLVQLAISSLQ